MRRLILSGMGLTAGLLLLGFSCQGPRPWFSHREHVGTQGLACADCHRSEDGIHAGAPQAESCEQCHEEATRYAGLAREMAEKWPRLKVLPADAIFSHARHTQAGVECQKCHSGVAESRRVSGRHLPTEAECLKCHRESGVGTDCQVCHQTLRPGIRPPDHDRAWETGHGEASRDPVLGERCSRCHEPNLCVSCHQAEPPRDHNAGWRHFGHGVESALDRNRCAACHQTDFCVACHEATVPASHRPGWGAPGQWHCLSCHLTGGEVSNCSACHSTNVRHLSATPRPDTAPHVMNTDCRDCHTGFLLPHPDNGDNCKICHKL